MVLFSWVGFEDMDDVTNGSAELLDNGSFEVRFAYTTAARLPSSPTDHFFKSLPGADAADPAPLRGSLIRSVGTCVAPVTFRTLNLR